MTSLVLKKIQGLVLVMTMFGYAYGSDILLNDDFSDGKTHWHGDGESSDTGGKLVIALNPDRWTAVTQRFSASATTLQLSITYSLSDDCTLGKNGDKLIEPLTPQALKEACGVESGRINIPMSRHCLWTALVFSGGLLISEERILALKTASPSSDPSGDKVFTADLNSYFGQFQDCDICLCFPPGQGSVTLTGVKLVPPGQ